ncbi:hypothetical protein PMAC_001630 [Pneumocystis sp. 'macacae']|nr:hypothetical protein PMAC_001630 [Pneumocystis sp. 'macacae']
MTTLTLKSFLQKNLHKTWKNSVLINPVIAERAVNILELNTYHDATVIEMGPGPGMMTQALLKKVKPKYHILMEPNKIFHPFLEKIRGKSPNQVILTELDGFLWSSYSKLVTQELLKPTYQPMDRIHSSLLFVAHLPYGSLGEQLLVQFFTARFDEIWIHQYGRIRMLLWITTPLAKRLLAIPGKPGRCRLGIVRESVADCRVIVGNNDFPGLQPTLKTVSSDFIREKDLILIEVIPLSKIPTKTPLEIFDYVVRHLFALKKTPLIKALGTLGPGADTLAKELSSELLEKKVDEMTRDDFDEIAQLFDKWPFRPKILFDQWNKISVPQVKLGRIWGQYFQNISKKIICKRPQFHCSLFNLRFYPRKDLNTPSSDGENIEKSVYRVNRQSNVYYLRGLIRITVLTSKKRISNIACTRSKIRRRLREAARQVLLFRDKNGFPYLPVMPYDLFFVAKADILDEDWKKLLWYVKKGLQKAQQILNDGHISSRFVSIKINDLKNFSIEDSSLKKKTNQKHSIYQSFKTKPLNDLEKQETFQSNDLITLQFIRFIIKLTNSPCSTSTDTLSKSILFLLEHYKLRKITLFDIEMLINSSKQFHDLNISRNSDINRILEIDD